MELGSSLSETGGPCRNDDGGMRIARQASSTMHLGHDGGRRRAQSPRCSCAVCVGWRRARRVLLPLLLLLLLRLRLLLLPRVGWPVQHNVEAAQLFHPNVPRRILQLDSSGCNYVIGPASQYSATHRATLLLRFKHHLLRLHLVKNIVPLHRLTHWHHLVRHEPSHRQSASCSKESHRQSHTHPSLSWCTLSFSSACGNTLRTGHLPI